MKTEIRNKIIISVSVFIWICGLKYVVNALMEYKYITEIEAILLIILACLAIPYYINYMSGVNNESE